jgi:hypothetical protein
MVSFAPKKKQHKSHHISKKKSQKLPYLDNEFLEVAKTNHDSKIKSSSHRTDL